MFKCQTLETTTCCRFDEPSLIVFPPSLSTTTPQKKARLVTEATFKISRSSPEARGTAFLGEVLKTMESGHDVKTRWTSPTFVPIDVCLSHPCFPLRHVSALSSHTCSIYYSRILLPSRLATNCFIRLLFSLTPDSEYRMCSPSVSPSDSSSCISPDDVSCS